MRVELSDAVVSELAAAVAVPVRPTAPDLWTTESAAVYMDEMKQNRIERNERLAMVAELVLTEIKVSLGGGE